MIRTGTASLPLHGGKAPHWLFKRMVLLSKGIFEILMYEWGKEEVLKRLSDPFWFQALSCVLGFDWHSSGATTVTCGALHEAIDPLEYGLASTGGKGKASRKTKEEIEKIGLAYNFTSKKIQQLQYSSRMTAKIDNSVIQDGYNLYHHMFIFSESGSWGVIQQGLNTDVRYARRYHWYSENVQNFILEPHNGILGQRQHSRVLDMSSKKSIEAQKICVDIVNEHPRHLIQNWGDLTRHYRQMTLLEMYKSKHEQFDAHLHMPRTINWKKMKQIYDIHPRNYEELIAIKGVGPQTVRALALVSELIYGEKPSWKDPVKFTFTVGGKDGIPYPVDTKTMDQTTDIIQQGIQQVKIGNNDKLKAIQRLHNFFSLSTRT